MMWIFSQDVQMIKALYNSFPYTFFEFEIEENNSSNLLKKGNEKQSGKSPIFDWISP